MIDLPFSEKVKYGIITLGALGFVVLYVREFEWFQNTIEIQNLIIWSVLTGAVAGVLLGLRLSGKREDTVDRMRLMSALVLGGIIVLPLVTNLVNRLAVLRGFEPKEVELFDQKAFQADLGILEGDAGQPDGYFTFFFWNDKLVRVKSQEPLFPGAEKGDKVFLPMKRGALGFWIVDTSR